MPFFRHLRLNFNLIYLIITFSRITSRIQTSFHITLYAEYAKEYGELSLLWQPLGRLQQYVHLCRTSICVGMSLFN